MESAYELIRDAEIVPLAFLSGLLFFIGKTASVRWAGGFQIGSCLAGIGFLTFCVMAARDQGLEPVEDTIAWVIRGGLFAGIVAGMFWTISAVAAGTWEIIAPLPRRLERSIASVRHQARAAREHQLDASERQRLAERQRQEWEQSQARFAEREKQQQESALRKESERQRRVEARAQCDLNYSLHASEIDDRFSKAMLDAFMQTYMSDTEPIEAVERRGRELQRIVEQHREAVKPTKKFHTIQELAEWYVEEKQRIEGLPLDEELRKEQTIWLDIRYADLTHELLQKAEP